MIAASDPQEYIPSGRQQIIRHPGPLETDLNEAGETDDFLLHKIKNVSLADVKQNDWWILRKVESTSISSTQELHDSVKYEVYNKSNNRESIYKTRKSDILDDSSGFRTGEETSFNKFGKRLSDTSSFKFSNKRLSVGSEQGNVTKPGRNTSRNVSDDQKLLENFLFPNNSNITHIEDELYVRGHTVIWSRGLVNNIDNPNNGRKTICCYTLKSPVDQALWSTFYCERPIFGENEHFFEMGKNDSSVGTPMESICVSSSHVVKVFTVKGEDFTISIPFVIGKLWNTKYGIFIEKQNETFPNESVYETSATLFSLSHPLDDICPVARHQGGTVNVWNNSNYIIVFSSKTPSICMIYDIMTKLHSVYLIRKLRPDEANFDNKVTSGMYSLNHSNKMKHRLSVWNHNIGKTINIPSLSPLSQKLGSGNNLGVLPSRCQSSMAMMSRCQSPALSSCTTSPWLPSKVNTSSRSSIHNKSYFDYSKTVSYLRSSPKICLEYLWTDTHTSQDYPHLRQASRVFLIDDMIGQWFLCYFLPSIRQLVMVKIDFSDSSNISFGIPTSIVAKDAIPIPELHMLAILDHNGNVTLHSGLTSVGKIHIGGTLAQHVPSPFVRRKMQNFNYSPFPRRSSLLPHLNSMDPKFDEHLLSPVLPAGSNFKMRNVNIPHLSLPEHDVPKISLDSFSEAIDNKITLKYSDGTYYRITLPCMATSLLVQSCLLALMQVLPSEICMHLLCKWYAARNVIGAADITGEQEWTIFTSLLFEMLGYEDCDSEIGQQGGSYSAVKKPKFSSAKDEDWNYIVTSIHGNNLRNLNKTLKLPEIKTKDEVEKCIKKLTNRQSILFIYIRIIHFTLHLVYEDLKLNTLRSHECLPIVKLLYILSTDIGLTKYSIYYWRDFPEQVSGNVQSTSVPKKDLGTVLGHAAISEEPVSVMKYIYNLISAVNQQPYPYLKNVNVRSRDIVQICGIISQIYDSVPFEVMLESFVKEINISGINVPNQSHKSIIINETRLHQVVLLMVDMKITTGYLDTLPFGIYYLIYNTLWKCRENPPSDWPADAYYLLWREDLAAQALKLEKEKQESSQELLGMYSNTQLEDVMPGIKTDSEQTDGMEDIDNSLTKLRFNEDVRVNEARKMLQSSKPVPIVLTQRPDISDHDFIEEQEKHLYGICIRTMALPAGRGMFTLRTATPVITEPLPAPPLCLTGKAPPRGTTVDLNHIDTPANMNLWPLFHNGVANGLRITPDAHNIDNTWIIFNKSKGGNDQQMEHAGFLLALGLNGHLKNLALHTSFIYLDKLHEMTSVGILLGLSAAFRGTCHPALIKTLAIHVEALLPPTSMEIDIPQTLQVAGLLGIGLVYQGTSNRHMAEVLLSEIGRPPGPEMENSVDRESYSLAAGLALGLVTLKHGEHSSGLSDLNLPDALHYYMVGGNKRPLTGAQKDKYKTSSFQIREGSSVNLDVTAPGATLALGLMFLGTGNKTVADWMAPPKTQYLLDFVRPDFLLLRILARSLIMWNDIQPNKKWVEGQVPSTIRPYCMVKPEHSSDIDYEAMNQAYCNIVAGASFALGLRFAGTADKDAFETLLYFCHMFTSLSGKSIAELAGKSTIETCLNILLLSASMVMAGTGNLELMRLIRHLRRRIGVSNSPVVTYGSHLAIHMALGLLFLGGGRYTLSNSPSSIAALICAFYPKFPTHSSDNRYHLQAFRHLYVLGVEPRLIIPKEVHTDEICYANLKILHLNGVTINMKGPGIIPDLSTLFRVVIEDERYWPVRFEKGHNWDLLEKILLTTGYIEVKQRAGCLNYVADKFGYRSQLARTLTQSKVIPWDPSPSSIITFTSDKSVKLFCKHFLKNEKNDLSFTEVKLKQALCRITYDAVVKDKLIVIVIFLAIVKIITDLKDSPNSLNIWQIKLILKQVFSNDSSTNLVSKETALSLKEEMTNHFERWEETSKPILKKYLLGENFHEGLDKFTLQMLSCYSTFYDLPYDSNISQRSSLLQLFIQLQSCNLSTETITKIIKICDLER